MKKYLVIGNPIEHSLSPQIHNYWLNKHKINALYEKKLLKENDLKEIISEIKNEKIDGINVTLPFKKKIIPFLDELSPEATESQSVNTVYIENKKIFGHNTDIAGFELGIRHIKYDVKNKAVFIFGAGGVVPSIIVALKKMKVSKIFLCNRTEEKAKELKKNFKELEIKDWGDIPPETNIIINATSLGLGKDDNIQINHDKIGSNKLFYDVVYNPRETNFLKKAKQYKNNISNGKLMFVYQAHQAFTIWHKIMPKIDDEVINLLDND